MSMLVDDANDSERARGPEFEGGSFELRNISRLIDLERKTEVRRCQLDA